MFRSTLKRGCVPAAVVVAMLAGCAGGQADKADPVGSTTATLNGYWQSTRPAGSIAVFVYFKYGTTTAYGSRAFGSTADGNCQVGWVPQSSACFALGPANTIHKYSVPVSGLAPNTTYHFSLCAADADQTKRHLPERRDIQDGAVRLGLALATRPPDGPDRPTDLTATRTATRTPHRPLRRLGVTSSPR